MDNKLLLVKCITLLYRENLLTTSTDSSREIVRNVLETIKLPDAGVSVSRERIILAALKNTALEMCDDEIDHIYEKTEILQRLKSNTDEDDKLYETFEQGIEPELLESSIKRSIVNMRKSINNHFKEQKIEEILNASSISFKFHRDKIKNVKQFVAELCSKLEPFQLDSDNKDPAILAEVDTSDINGMINVFSSIQDDDNGSTVLKTGWQGINRMLDGGFRRGEEWVIGALQHNYKTGFSLSIFKHLALYNTPILTDATKKPLLVRFTFEDNLNLNFQFLYQSLKESETGESVNIYGVTVEEMAAYVKQKLSVNGYHTKFVYVNPSLWGYKDMCNKIVEFEAEGYEVHVCMADYLLKLQTTGCDQGPSGHDIRNMYERVKNFMAARNILFITPHQLSTEAKMTNRGGSQEFVKGLIGGGYYAGSKQIDQVVDGEIFIHIETVNKESYLTIQRGKHRKIKQTPSEHLYMALKFDRVGIPDDINCADSTRKRVGHGTAGTDSSVPFWDTNPI